MSLQLLIENVIKHNKHSDKDPIIITIKRLEDFIAVSNNFRPIKQLDQSTHVGLGYLRKHCLHITGKDCIVHQNNNLFEVKIPVIKKNRDESTYH